MLHTKRLKIILIVLIILFSPILLYKIQGTRIHWIRFESKKIGDDTLDVFLIQNPPASKEELIKLIEDMNDTLKLKIRVNNKNFYTQSFYKESFHLTRFFKPYRIAVLGNSVDIRKDYEGDYDQEHLADCFYKDNETEKDCGKWCPIYPYFRISEESYSICEYYPKGLKGSPLTKWRKIRNSGTTTTSVNP
jgi:hypothetical protein